MTMRAKTSVGMLWRGLGLCLWVSGCGDDDGGDGGSGGDGTDGQGLPLWPEDGQLQVLGREPCDPGPASAEAYSDKYVNAGDTVEEDIAGCRYRMLLSSQEPGFPATPYTIRIEEVDG